MSELIAIGMKCRLPPRFVSFRNYVGPSVRSQAIAPEASNPALYGEKMGSIHLNLRLGEVAPEMHVDPPALPLWRQTVLRHQPVKFRARRSQCPRCLR